MKSKFVRKLSITLVTFVLMAGMAVSGSASTVAPTNNGAVLVASESIEITPYADVIVLKTRVYNGILQYRHWNETKGYWIEPDWVNG